MRAIQILACAISGPAIYYVKVSDWLRSENLNDFLKGASSDGLGPDMPPLVEFLGPMSGVAMAGLFVVLAAIFTIHRMPRWMSGLVILALGAVLGPILFDAFFRSFAWWSSFNALGGFLLFTGAWLISLSYACLIAKWMVGRSAVRPGTMGVVFR